MGRTQMVVESGSYTKLGDRPDIPLYLYQVLYQGVKEITRYLDGYLLYAPWITKNKHT